jgi:hypothetical protein
MGGRRAGAAAGPNAPSPPTARRIPPRPARAPCSPDEFLGLTDAVLLEARNSADPGLAEAAGLVKRLERRDVYTFCAEVRARFES